MAKKYAADAVSCPADGSMVHSLVYMGHYREEGQSRRSLEYRCNNCGEFIKKADLQKETQYVS